MRVPSFARNLLDPVTTRVSIPILSGVNRGMRWSLASAGHGYGTGTRAAAQMGMLAELVEQGDVVWDVGAHHGYVTLAAARRAGRRGEVHAFEPSRANRVRLRQHVAWNGLRNVTVHDCALAAHEGETCFGGQGSSKTFCLGGGDEQVRVATGAALIAAGTCPVPDLAKIDVENAEGETLRGALGALGGSARLLIAMHSRESYVDCRAQLEAAGYALVPSRAAVAALDATDANWPGDPDVYAIGPQSTRRAHDAAVLAKWGF